MKFSVPFEKTTQGRTATRFSLSNSEISKLGIRQSKLMVPLHYPVFKYEHMTTVSPLVLELTDNLVAQTAIVRISTCQCATLY